MNKARVLALLSTATLCTALHAQENIAEARLYNVGQIATVTGVVTNGPTLGSIRYMQDETAGIAIYPGANWNNLDFTPQVGDSITVTGEISEFASLLEVGPTINSMVLHASGLPLPDPLVVTPAEIDESLEGMLIHVVGAVFADGGSSFGSSTYGYTAQGEEGVIYVNSNSPLIGELVPTGPVDLTGILSQFSFDDPGTGYQLLPRGLDDIVSENPINFASEVSQSNLNQSSITLSWTTDVAASSGIRYGTSPDDLGEIITSNTAVTQHSLTLENLQSGKPYFCQVFSVAGTDTLRGVVDAYSTVSESSGEIRVFFNRAVDTSVSTGQEAMSLFSATDDTIVSLIDRAQHTLDLAIYNCNSGTIVQAINNALDRGVVVRYITEGQNANLGLQNLDPAIPVLERQNAVSSGMHNKFVIVDAEDTDSAMVLTGSMNFTTNNLFDDPNNFLIIQDQALARAYTIEFEEMWGSSLPEPNFLQSRFGENKTNNTPEKFLIGGRPVELYFSPSDGTTAGIQQVIEHTDYNLDFALLLITNNILSDAIISETSIFVTPRGIVENTDDSGSDYLELQDAGVNLHSHQDVEGQLHHKYAIIDYSEAQSDPTVVTGSHNWTSSAESVNDENTLIIHDATIANLYEQEFTALWNATVLSATAPHLPELKLYPNPTRERLFVSVPGSEVLPYRIYDIHGRQLVAGRLTGSALNLGHLSAGVYTLLIEGYAPAKLVLQ